MSHRRHLASLQRWDTYFDQGNAESVVDDDGKIRITPYRYVATNTWVWFSVRSDRLGGKIPHFLIAKANRFGALPGANENQAVWSTSSDTDTWYKFDNQIIGASDLEFYNNSPFPNGMIYISYLPLYPWSRYQRIFREWMKDSRVTLNHYGQDTRRPVRDGRVAPALPFLGLTVTNNSGFTKGNMVLTAANHPNETEGPYQLEGAMSWLLGGSYEAEFLLDYYNVYVYPCINPQGVVAGYTRSGPQHYDAWHGDFETPPSFGVYYDDIDALKSKMISDTGNDIEVGIDFHGTVGDSTGYLNCNDHTETLYARFLQLMQGYASFGYVDEVLPYALTGVWRDHYSTVLSAVVEGGAKTTIDIPSFWKTQGQYTLRSLTKMLAESRFAAGPGVGSRSFNGATDRIDWSSQYSPAAGTPMTVSFWAYVDTVPTNGYIWFAANSGNTGYILINISGGASGYIGFIVDGSTDLQRSSGSGVVTTGSWIQFIVTWDGVITSYSGVHIYKSGTEVSYSVQTNGAGEISHASLLYHLGGRSSDDLRNVDAKLAQFAVWDRVLAAGERTNLVEGYAPDLVDGGTNLKFYFKGNTTSLVASPGGTGTADGTTHITGLGNGPGIIY